MRLNDMVQLLFNFFAHFAHEKFSTTEKGGQKDCLYRFFCHFHKIKLGYMLVMHALLYPTAHMQYIVEYADAADIYNRLTR